MNKKPIIIYGVAGSFLGMAAFLTGFAISSSMFDSFPLGFIVVICACGFTGSLVIYFGEKNMK